MLTPVSPHVLLYQLVIMSPRCDVSPILEQILLMFRASYAEASSNTARVPEEEQFQFFPPMWHRSDMTHECVAGKKHMDSDISRSVSGFFHMWKKIWYHSNMQIRYCPVNASRTVRYWKSNGSNWSRLWWTRFLGFCFNFVIRFG